VLGIVIKASVLVKVNSSEGHLVHIDQIKMNNFTKVIRMRCVQSIIRDYNNLTYLHECCCDN